MPGSYQDNTGQISAKVSVSRAASGVPGTTLACDDNLKALDLGAGASITLVKAFKKGEALSIVTPAPANVMTATADLCLVKIIVGPGNPGPACAPSRSAGIGIEVWLPARARWNERYLAFGGGGFDGGPDITSLTQDLGAPIARQNRWRTIGYTGPASFAEVFAAAQQRLGAIASTSNPELSAFANRGGRLLMWHGTGDSLIFPQGTINYYEAVAANAGGYA